MVAPEFETRLMPYPTNFILAVIDDCNESERAVRALMDIGLQPKDIQLFHGNHGLERTDPPGGRIGPLQRTLQYLDRLGQVKGPFLREYEDHGDAGRHVLLINIHRPDQVKHATTVLAGSLAHTVRHFGCWQITSLLPIAAPPRASASREAECVDHRQAALEEWHNDDPGGPEVVTLRELQAVDIFTWLSESEIGHIVRIGKYVEVPQDTMLSKQGERATSIYAILKGQVQFTASSPQGQITVRIAGRGESVPLAALVGTGKLITSAHVMSDLKAVEISCEAIKGLFHSQPEMGMKVYGAIAGILVGRYDSTLTRLADTLEQGLRQAGALAELEQ